MPTTPPARSADDAPRPDAHEEPENPALLFSDPTTEPGSDPAAADEATASPALEADADGEEEPAAGEEELGEGGRNALQRERDARRTAERRNRELTQQVARAERSELVRRELEGSGLANLLPHGYDPSILVTGDDEHQVRKSVAGLVLFASMAADHAGNRHAITPAERSRPTVADDVMRA